MGHVDGGGIEGYHQSEIQTVNYVDYDGLVCQKQPTKIFVILGHMFYNFWRKLLQMLWQIKTVHKGIDG